MPRRFECGRAFSVSTLANGGDLKMPLVGSTAASVKNPLLIFDDKDGALPVAQAVGV